MHIYASFWCCFEHMLQTALTCAQVLSEIFFFLHFDLESAAVVFWAATSHKDGNWRNAGMQNVKRKRSWRDNPKSFGCKRSTWKVPLPYCLELVQLRASIQLPLETVAVTVKTALSWHRANRTLFYDHPRGPGKLAHYWMSHGWCWRPAVESEVTKNTGWGSPCAFLYWWMRQQGEALQRPSSRPSFSSWLIAHHTWPSSPCVDADENNHRCDDRQLGIAGMRSYRSSAHQRSTGLLARISTQTHPKWENLSVWWWDRGPSLALTTCLQKRFFAR